MIEDDILSEVRRHPCLTVAELARALDHPVPQVRRVLKRLRETSRLTRRYKMTGGCQPDWILCWQVLPEQPSML